MKTQGFNYFGTSRLWWLLLLAGIILILGGFSYWLWPAAGFAVASIIFGWLLVATGVVELCVVAGKKRPRGWGWWLVGGIINVFVGFMLVSNVFLAEAVLPYFLAFIFFYWGIMAVARAINGYKIPGWWLYLINGILLIIIAGFFLGGGYLQEMNMVSFLAAISFIYWGFVVASFAVDLRPRHDDEM